LSVLHPYSLEPVLPALELHICSFAIYRLSDLLQCEDSQLLEILCIAITHYHCLFRMITVIVHIKTQHILHIEKQYLD